MRCRTALRQLAWYKAGLSRTLLKAANTFRMAAWVHDLLGLQRLYRNPFKADMYTQFRYMDPSRVVFLLESVGEDAADVPKKPDGRGDPGTI